MLVLASPEFCDNCWLQVTCVLCYYHSVLSHLGCWKLLHGNKSCLSICHSSRFWVTAISLPKLWRSSPSYPLQFLQENTKSLWSWMGVVITPACPGSAVGAPPSAPQLKTPQQNPLDVEQQLLHRAHLSAPFISSNNETNTRS